ncbi:Kelch repeat-containing protein [Thermoleophilum album]|uniref:Galactose oxidase, central domain n=1 Tax=Thermoleophilum album TaxID=29539 RepID=A0A1H6FYB9_THEAL|nr:kelch repeat-containing protein [Thermoleophilum album]SEH15797.1 Galactose oxidase, central domain [Thermoleophilum album]
MTTVDANATRATLVALLPFSWRWSASRGACAKLLSAVLTAALTWLGAFAGPGYAASVPRGAFFTTAPLPRPVMLTEAAVLADGRVLVAGGFSEGGGTATAALFEPRSRRWLPTGRLAVGRFAHTVTALPDGGALVCGGSSVAGPQAGYLNSCERFDPAAGHFGLAPALPGPRANHAAVLVPNGPSGAPAVVITGGLTRSTPALTTVDALTVGAAAWQPLMALENGRYHHTATVLPDGRVLVVGGERTDRDTPLFSAELVDPRSGRSEVVAPTATPRVNHIAVLLRDGRVLVAGGGTFATGFLRSAEIFDPRTLSWREAAPMLHARGYAQATRLSDGRVLVVGGFSNDGDLPEAEIYDPQRNRWTVVPERPRPRARGIVAALADGRVLLAGGQRASGQLLRDSELFDPLATARLAELVAPRRAHAGRTVAIRYWSGSAGPTTIDLLAIRKPPRGRCPNLTGPCELRRLVLRLRVRDGVGRRLHKLPLARRGRALAPGRYELRVRHAGREASVRLAITR